jgi:hypothetical protein
MTVATKVPVAPQMPPVMQTQLDTMEYVQRAARLEQIQRVYDSGYYAGYEAALQDVLAKLNVNPTATHGNALAIVVNQMPERNV